MSAMTLFTLNRICVTCKVVTFGKTELLVAEPISCSL